MVLVALSCVTVLGIAMVAFLAVSSQATRLSNRGYAQTVSKNLAEMGLERALGAFNTSNGFYGTWTLPDGVTTSSWTLPTTTTATTSFTIPSSYYGTTGITATINVRVNNFRDTRKAEIWSSLLTYSVGDYVWYQGVWYRCISAPPAKQAPSNTTYWKGAPESWSPHANYRVGNIALSGGFACRCRVDHVNQPPPSPTPPNPTSSTYWDVPGTAVAVWSATSTYNVDDVVLSGGLAYRCLAANSNQVPPNTSYWLSAPVIYAEGVVTLPDVGGTTIKTQIRATVAPAPLFPNAIGAKSDVIMSNSTLSAGYVDSYNQVLGAYTPYSSTTNRSASAVVAGGDIAVSNAVASAGMRIYGFVAATSNNTSPYAPRWTYSSSTGWVTGNVSAWYQPTPSINSPPSPRFDLTRVTRSPHVPNFDIQNVSGATVLPAPINTTVLPNGATSLGTAGAATPAIYNITQTGAAMDSGLYLNDLADVLTINGPVILRVSGPVYIGSGKIVIANTGSLEIYFDGQLWVDAGSTNGIDNQAPSSGNPDPKKCILVGTSTDNYYGAHSYQSTRPFYGVIYMPDAYVAICYGTAGTAAHYYGAISAKNVRFPNRNVAFHYDTSLRTAGTVGTYIDGPYRIAEWRELSDAGERITLP